MIYPCELCKQEEAVKKQKYCKDCKRSMLQKMQEDGYLDRRQFGHAGDARTSEAREKTYETKHGTGHG